MKWTTTCKKHSNLSNKVTTPMKFVEFVTIPASSLSSTSPPQPFGFYTITRINPLFVEDNSISSSSTSEGEYDQEDRDEDEDDKNEIVRNWTYEPAAICTHNDDDDDDDDDDYDEDIDKDGVKLVEYLREFTTCKNIDSALLSVRVDHRQRYRNDDNTAVSYADRVRIGKLHDHVRREQLLAPTLPPHVALTAVTTTNISDRFCNGSRCSCTNAAVNSQNVYCQHHMQLCRRHLQQQQLRYLHLYCDCDGKQQQWYKCACYNTYGGQRKHFHDLLARQSLCNAEIYQTSRSTLYDRDCKSSGKSEPFAATGSELVSAFASLPLEIVFRCLCDKIDEYLQHTVSAMVPKHAVKTFDGAHHVTNAYHSLCRARCRDNEDSRQLSQCLGAVDKSSSYTVVSANQRARKCAIFSSSCRSSTSGFSDLTQTSSPSFSVSAVTTTNSISTATTTTTTADSLSLFAGSTRATRAKCNNVEPSYKIKNIMRIPTRKFRNHLQQTQVLQCSRSSLVQPRPSHPDLSIDSVLFNFQRCKRLDTIHTKSNFQHVPSNASASPLPSSVS